jgi:hypothetical protein
MEGELSDDGATAWAHRSSRRHPLPESTADTLAPRPLGSVTRQRGNFSLEIVAIFLWKSWQFLWKLYVQ